MLQAVWIQRDYDAVSVIGKMISPVNWQKLVDFFKCAYCLHEVAELMYWSHV